MTDALFPAYSKTHPLSDASLKASRTFWFVTTLIGQWTFVYFIVTFYYGTTLRGDFEAWNKKPLIDGYHPADPEGNLVFASHVLLAAIMTGGGILQLVPSLRNRILGFHRWNGRLFLACSSIIAVGGLYLVWVRGTYLSLIAAVAITLDAVLIVFFGVMTLRYAIARDIAAHRRWALRTFMAANAVWMFRVGYMFWALTTRGAGVTKSMDGPFDVFWVFSCYLLPLALLEAYLRAQASRRPAAKLALSVVLLVSTLAMGVGIVGAYRVLWGPYVT